MYHQAIITGNGSWADFSPLFSSKRRAKKWLEKKLRRNPSDSGYTVKVARKDQAHPQMNVREI